MSVINTMFNITRMLVFALLLANMAQVELALAQDNIVDIIPAKAGETAPDENAHTHPPIRLTPDKSEIVNLDRKAASIIIGNPNHLSIMADAADRVILVPRAPGASYFTILDHEGKVIMQRHAIIASPKQQYVRIRRSCANGGDNCQETSVFYCPDTCHEIMMKAADTPKNPNAAQEAFGTAAGEVAGQDLAETVNGEPGSEE